MAILNFGGAEEGNSSYAAFLYASGQSITSSVARTGTYSYNNSTNTTSEYMLFGALSGLLPVSLNTTSERFFTCYFRMGSVSIGGDGPIIVATGSTPTSQVICSLNVAPSGALTFVGTTTVSAGSFTSNVWHRADMRVTSNSTCYVKIDGGTEYSVTGNNFTLAAMGFGSPAATTDLLVRFDDWVIDDAAFPTYDPEVKIAVANAAGTYTGWTNGTGSTYAEVDEVTSDTTTTYIQNTSGTDVASTFRMQSKSTVGISGAIKGVMPTIVGHEPSSTTTQVGIRVRSGATDYDTSTPDLGSTVWITRRVLHLTDPSTSVAWTEAGFDAVEIGPLKGADSSSVRVSSVWALVLSDGIIPPADLVLSAAAGIASLATLTLSSPTMLALSSSPGVATVSNLILQSPTMLALAAVAGLASLTNTLSTPGYLTLGTVAGLSNSTLTLISPVLIPMTAAGVATVTGAVITLSNNELSLSPTGGVATVTGALSTTAQLTLSTVPGVATSTLALQGPALLTLSQVAGLSNATLIVRSPVLLTLTAAGLSTAAMTVSTTAQLVLSAVAGVATATNNVSSQVLFTLTAAGVATATATLISPVNLTLGAVAGLSNATLARLVSPALFTLQADGLSTATLAVRSPALFTLTTGGVAVPTLVLASPANLTLSTVAGVALALLSEISLGPSTKARIGSGYAPIVRITGGTIRPVIIQAGTVRPVRINGGY